MSDPGQEIKCLECDYIAKNKKALSNHLRYGCSNLKKDKRCKYCNKIINNNKPSRQKDFCDSKCFYLFNKKNNNSAWKGDSVSYTGIHDWINKNFGKPIKCEKCGSKIYVDWSNKDHKYSRKKEDWIALCRKCHFKKDGHNNFVNAAKRSKKGKLNPNWKGEK